MLRAVTWTLALALPCQALQSSVPLIDQTLVVDINVEPVSVPGSSDPAFLGTVGAEVYFTALSDSGPRRVYRTDGTPAGTVDVQTGQAGPLATDVGDAVVLPNGRLLARGEVGDSGDELVGIGTGYDGVELILDIDPSPTTLPFAGAGSSTPFELTEWNGEAWFFADDEIHGRELWRSDGTAAGTRLAFDLNPGFADLVNVTADIEVAGGKLYFNSNAPDVCLWVLHTPDAAPVKLSTNPVAPAFPVVQMAELGGDLIFDWGSEAAGRELWRSDGTPAGTTLLSDIVPGFTSSAPHLMGADNARVWFSASTPNSGRELWSTDGTPGGTLQVAELKPGPQDGVPIANGAPIGGSLVFPAPDDQLQPVLWRSDGTASGTAVFPDVDGNSVRVEQPDFVEWQGAIWFRGDNGSLGGELYVTDGTSAGTAVAVDIEPGLQSSDSRPLGAAPGFLFLGATMGGQGNEPFASDGTPGGTQMLGNLVLDQFNSGSGPALLRRFRDKLVFRATTPEFGLELYASDGTPGGTQLLVDARPGAAGSSPVPLTEIEAGLLFSVLPASTGRELWITDGTPQGTRQVGVFDDGSPPQGLFAQRLEGGLAYFFAPDGQGNEVWRTDGTPEGTLPVPGYPVVPTFSEINESLVQDGQWYFGADGGDGTGFELWRTDGTPSGTALVGDLVPGPDPSIPHSFTPFGDETVFVARTAAGAQELWITDGTLAGTQPFTDIDSGFPASGPTDLTLLGDRIVFQVNDGVHGSEPWVTNGTQAGTQLLADLLPGPEGSSPSFFERVGDELFFWASFEVLKRALYRTDGTPEGTVLVEDGVEPPALFSSTPLTAIGDVALFRASGAGIGRELWVTDGTSAGTHAVTDIATGPKGSNPFGMTVLGERVLFRASDIAFGSELHGIELSELGIWSADEVGLGCGAHLSASGSAAFGATLALESRSSAPLAPVALFIDTDLVFVSVGPDCQLHLADPLLFALLATDATGLAQLSLTVPSAPALAGLPLRFQSLASAPGGGFLGAFELSNALEIVSQP